MHRLTTLPSTREQARRALLVLGSPAPARLVAEVHGAFFDGDLSVPALAALLRSEERGWTPGTPWAVCPALTLDLTPVRGLCALSTWPVEGRISAPADHLAQVVRIAELAARHPGAAVTRLLRQLTETVPGGPEAADPAEVARRALAAVPRDLTRTAAAAARAELLDERDRLFGRPVVPPQRGGTR